MSLNKIISGTRAGAHRGALDAAIKYGFPYGGWVPKGRRDEDGPIPGKYKLQEMRTTSYPDRTQKNVTSSDGTLIITQSRMTSGSGLAHKFANKHGKPCVRIDLKVQLLPAAVATVHEWISREGIQVLNVAGSRESKAHGIQELTKQIIESLILLAMDRSDE